MPRLAAAHLDAVIAASRGTEATAATIIVPTYDRKRGNPVLWPRRYFAEIAPLTGDVGARALIERYADHVLFLPIDDPAILVDVDTPAALAALRGEPAGDGSGGGDDSGARRAAAAAAARSAPSRRRRTARCR